MSHPIGGVSGEKSGSLAERRRAATRQRIAAAAAQLVAEGGNVHWLNLITSALAAQPADLAATEAVVGAFGHLALGFAEIEDQVRELATLTRSSETLEAWA